MYPTKWSYIYCNNSLKITKAKQAIKEFLLHTKMLAVDVETTGLDTLDHSLRCVTIATSEEAFIFPVSRKEDIEAKGIKGIMEFLGDSSIVKLAHNGIFDWSYIKYHLDITMSPIMDTRKLAFVLKEPKLSLANLVIKYIGMELNKSYATSFTGTEELNEEQIRYTAIDAVCLFPLFVSLSTQAFMRDRFHTGILQEKDFDEMENYLQNGGSFPRRYGETSRNKVGE